MVGGYYDIGICRQTQFVERGTQLCQVVVGILDGSKRRRAVDARFNLQQAVAVIVLRAVRIA